MRHQGGEQNRLDLTARPGDVPPVVRLRHVLKALLRSYGFRATAVKETTPKLPQAAAGCRVPEKSGE